MNELLEGVVDGTQSAFTSKNPIGKHLLFVGGEHHLVGLQYDVVTDYAVEFRTGFVPQPSSDGSAPPIVLVHL